ARIKWPNDVLVRGRKACGILIEQSTRGERRVAVAGIGLNVRQSGEELAAMGLPEAISLAQVCQPPRTAEVARLLVAKLDEHLGPVLEGDFTSLEAQWQRRLGLLGELVTAEGADGIWRGRLTQLSFAAIELEASSGQILRLPPEAIRHLTLTDEA